MNPIILKTQSKALQFYAEQSRSEESSLKTQREYLSERQKEREAKAAGFKLEKLINYRRDTIRKTALTVFITRAILRERSKEHILHKVKEGVVHRKILEDVVELLQEHGELSETQAQEALTYWLESESTQGS